MKSAAVRDVERLAVLLDERYYYDGNGYLRSARYYGHGMSDVRLLFHTLNQAKEELALVVMENEKLYGSLLELI